MPDSLSGHVDSAPDGAAAFSRFSTLLRELAGAPPDDLLRAWQNRLQPGDVVGRFEILREIGRGGFGVVYEALDCQLARSVAFKTLRPALAGHDFSADWILKEAEAVARLDHPCIVTLYDVGRCESGPYLVEELLRGETLEHRLGRGPLRARDAVPIALELARGLAHAHSRGVLHRDLKPSNVFLTEDGRVKLLDFGLAHLLGTRGVQGAGTPGYMAPEQLRGEEVDARADVFALGATLYRALAGRAPFLVKDGRSASLDGAPPPAFPGGTPARVEALLLRCLARDPAERPASGQAVL
ncbi:MAG TPA: serine/threonine-protein kinase, partial [Anaeromyxobacteraceae bacterium]|nr:serine/threonine-protein kinase [Anaeromyxobacteraceae bacterium]